MDLRRVQVVQRVTTSFLQDVRSWIWMPVDVVVSVSTNGNEFREVARVGHDVGADEYGVLYRDLEAQLGGVEARYVRVVAHNYGAIPDWHPGHGGRAWIFVDEIFID